MKRFFTSPVVFAGTEKLLGSVPEVAAFHHRAKASCAHRARSWAGFPHPPAGLCRLAAGRIRPQPIQLHLASSEKRALLLFIPLPPRGPRSVISAWLPLRGAGAGRGEVGALPPPRLGSARLGWAAWSHSAPSRDKAPPPARRLRGAARLRSGSRPRGDGDRGGGVPAWFSARSGMMLCA